MKVTIIIPNYNGKHFMEPCLQSLANQTCSEFQILVVDNASSDGSIEYMRENYPDIELISLNQNYGFSAAVNVGIRHSTTPYVLLLNNDTTVAPEFVDEMIKAIEKSPKNVPSADDSNVSSRTHRQCRRYVYFTWLGILPGRWIIPFPIITQTILYSVPAPEQLFTVVIPFLKLVFLTKITLPI